MEAECPMCLDEFGENLLPHVIPCKEGHVFCRRCLKILFEGSPAANNVECWTFGENCPRRRHAKCPICQDVWHVRDDNLNNIVAVPRDKGNSDKFLSQRREKRRKILNSRLKLKQDGEKTVKHLKTIMADINKHATNCRISKLTGGGTSFIGGVLFIVGAALAIPTAGVSGGLMIAGAAVSATGGSVAAGAGITSLVLNSKVVTQTKEQYTDFFAAYADLADLIHELRIEISLESIVFGAISGGRSLPIGGHIFGIIRLAKLLASGGDDAAAGIFRAASVASKAFHIVGIALAGILVVADFASVIWNAYDIAKNNPATASKSINKVIENINGICKQFSDENFEELLRNIDEQMNFTNEK